MIREVTRDDIPVYVDVIRKSFKTVVDEFGFTIDNAPMARKYRLPLGTTA